MAFFEIPKEEEIPPEGRQLLDELRRLRGVETLWRGWLTYGLSPRILKARVTAEDNLFNQSSGKSAFSWQARNMAFMLIAHARRCDGCFGGSRAHLMKLGFDEPALDGFCANPAVLPLPDRERLFVKYVLQLATDPNRLQPKDFREMAAQGFSQENVLEMIGFAAFAVFNTIFTTATMNALNDE
jgi:alkylhydroperoxidase family enzyme